MFSNQCIKEYLFLDEKFTLCLLWEIFEREILLFVYKSSKEKNLLRFCNIWWVSKVAFQFFIKFYTITYFCVFAFKVSYIPHYAYCYSCNKLMFLHLNPPPSNGFILPSSEISGTLRKCNRRSWSKIWHKNLTNHVC